MQMVVIKNTDRYSLVIKMIKIVIRLQKYSKKLFYYIINRKQTKYVRNSKGVVGLKRSSKSKMSLPKKYFYGYSVF